MKMSTLKKWLLSGNVVLLLGLAMVLLRTVHDVREFDARQPLALGAPLLAAVPRDVLMERGQYAAIHELPIGPHKVEIPLDAPAKAPWHESFLARWKVISPPWIVGERSKSWALLESTDKSQKRVTAAPLAPGAQRTPWRSQGTPCPIAAFTEIADDSMLIDDGKGQWAMVTGIDREGIDITNERKETARIPYEKLDARQALGNCVLYPPAAASPARPKMTRQVRPHQWEVGEADQLDWSANYAAYADSVNLRAFHDSRTRQLQGLQLRAKSSMPACLTHLGLRHGDVISKVGDVAVTSPSQVGEFIASHRGVDTVRITFIRQGKEVEHVYYLTTQAAEVGAAPQGR